MITTEPGAVGKTRRLHKVEKANRRHARDEPGRRENRVIGKKKIASVLMIFLEGLNLQWGERWRIG